MSANPALDRLVVIDRLQVGPANVEKHRVSCPYVVEQGGRESRFDLEYRCEEDVFDPAAEADQNLAAVMSAQAALNYTLFCREMVFHGRYDGLDRRFLLGMAENTAREIYVNKLLQPNVFLKPLPEPIPPRRLRSYGRAKVRFSSPPPSATGSGLPRPVDASRYAILSSGGKDSLLSYGLLSELDRPVHPLFVNESGRHWFTALNAYRFFKGSVPSTARVWTNADRLFVWMLRHMGFVRQDFADLRSDYYPLRLWTVAVFLFGVLPVMTKRGIGHLVVGDEYDTTQPGRFDGIRHFNGLYDQSIFFDRALTRYFRSKGRDFHVFSLLRPLSELLIQKTLVERYPELQEHQVSCHAAHVKASRVMPCGRCEKCRRIMSMLTALGADPARCGYGRDLAAKCVETLKMSELHQEEEGVRQLFFLLGKADVGSPEIMKLRIHPRNSPLSVYPQDLTSDLLSILLEHADGAVKRQGHRWRDFDPLEETHQRRSTYG